MQQNPILATKLYFPSNRTELVSRPHLIKRLNAGLGQNGLQKSSRFACKLTLVSAPAGFGKTTLVSDWVQTMDLETPPIVIAWLSLDEDDNDPIRFLTYFINALNRSKGTEVNIGKGCLRLLQSPQAPPT